MINATKIFLLSLLIIQTAIASSSAYTPEGLYNPSIYTLDNGLRVIHKQRDGAKYVSIRLVVNVGLDHFDCNKRHVPHFLEHMMFMGTTKHTESELEELIPNAGGSWNASTDVKTTDYELDIHSTNKDLGLNILHEIIIDSVLDQNNFDATREIIQRELGGESTVLKEYLYEKGFQKSSYTFFLEEIGVICKTIPTVKGITLDDVQKAYNKYYTPENMELIIVGDYLEDELKVEIQNTFGSILRSDGSIGFNNKLPIKTNVREFYSSFSPIIGTNDYISVAYLTEGHLHPIHPILSILSEYMNMRLYKVLRIDNQYSYTPSSDLSLYDKWGVFSLGADVKPEQADDVIEIISYEVGQIGKGNLDLETFNKAKLGLLLKRAYDHETNSDYADYYSASLSELDEFGYFQDEDNDIENVTIDDVKEFVSSYLTMEKRFILIDRPSITYAQLWGVIMIPIMLGGYILLYVVIRRKNA